MRRYFPNVFIKLYFFWLVFVFFSTETLSYFHAVTRGHIVLSNVLFFAAFFYLFKKEFPRFKFNVRIESVVTVIIPLILLLTFIQGFLSAPSTTDAMTYQINRVMYWIQDHTTHQNFLRNSHDFMPPFASYILLHLYMLIGSDRMLFFSQWLAFVVSVYLSGEIALMLGAHKQIRRLIMLLVATIPIVVLQASSTQADMVMAVLTLFVFYFILELVKKPNHNAMLLAGLAVGLGMLVKAPFYIFVIIPLSLLLPLLLRSPKKAITAGAVILVIALLMNTRYYYQNTKLYGSPLGQKFQGKGNTYVNERFDIPALASNLIKDTMNNIPVPFFHKQVYEVVSTFHSNVLGVDIKDSDISYSGLDFAVHPVIYPQEDLVASPLSALIIILAGFIVFRKNFKSKRRNELRILYAFLLLSYVIFAFILKYESVHNRLLVSFLLTGTIIGGLILSENKTWRQIIRVFAILNIPIAFLLILFNVSHPYISYKYFFNQVKGFASAPQALPAAFYEKPRLEQYFNSRPYLYMPYDVITDIIAQGTSHKKIIVINHSDDEFEYPLWVLLQRKGVNFYVQQNTMVKRPIKPDSYIINVAKNPLKKIGYISICIKTAANYGFVCLLKENDNL